LALSHDKIRKVLCIKVIWEQLHNQELNHSNSRGLERMLD